MPQLTVNLDLLARLRAMGQFPEPDPAQAAVLAELAGADGISIPFRQKQSYVKYRDLYLLRGVVKTKLILEIPPADDVVKAALEIKPWMVTLVADHTDIAGPFSPIDFDTVALDWNDIVLRFTGENINVCCFIDPEVNQVKAAAKAKASAVLINSSGYGRADTVENARMELDRIDRTVQAAVKTNLGVYCGRGLNYKNLAPLIELGYIDEFVIGQTLCTRAMLVGFERAVRDMIELTRIDRRQV